MPELINLDEALQGILDGIEDLLSDAIKKDGFLEDQKVETLVIGDKSRPAPRPPAVWVRLLNASCDHSQRTMAEKWTVEAIVLAIVSNTDPKIGYSDANKLAARARSIIIKDKTLNNRKFVQDVRSLRFDPSGPQMQNENLCAAVAILRVDFIILENNP